MTQRLPLTLISAAIASGLIGLTSPAGRSQPAPSTPEPSTPSTIDAQPLPITPENNMDPVENHEQSLECPAGQFPSAFPDVLPEHWAYTAVNRLASLPMQCFDYPSTDGQG